VIARTAPTPFFAALTLAGALLSALVAGCSLLLPARPDVTAGDRLVVTEDSAMQQVQGTSLEKLDHRALLRGQPGAVLPAGAVLSVVDRRDPRVVNTGSTASHADHNPWIYVKVERSPIAGQAGWEGWIHYRTTARDGPVAAGPPELGGRIARPARLCPTADSNRYQCSVNLPADIPVRIIGCEASKVWIELWTGDGFYMSGFVGRDQFDEDPCRHIASKE
jgi:hypothetical protein